MPCVEFSLFISLACSRFPVACLSSSVRIRFPHACVSLRVCIELIMFPISGITRLTRRFRCWRQNAAGTWWQSWYNEKYWVVHFSSNCLHILGQLWSFAVSHSYEHPHFEQSLWSNGLAGLSLSNFTVTSRSRSWRKTCAFSVICIAHRRGRSNIPFQSIHCIWAEISQHCALKLPNTQWTYNLLCLWRVHKKIKRSLMFGLSLHISRQIPRYFACTTFL